MPNQEVTKFFEQFRGAPAITAFTNDNQMDYMKECIEETGKGKVKEKVTIDTDEAEKTTEKVSEMVE